MSKTKIDKTKKNKGSKKKPSLAGAQKSLQKKGQPAGLGRLSPTQKVVGSLALATLGLRYLAKRRSTAKRSNSLPDANGTE